jgi:hypothetical protein
MAMGSRQKTATPIREGARNTAVAVRRVFALGRYMRASFPEVARISLSAF